MIHNQTSNPCLDAFESWDILVSATAVAHRLLLSTSHAGRLTTLLFLSHPAACVQHTSFPLSTRRIAPLTTKISAVNARKPAKQRVYTADVRIAHATPLPTHTQNHVPQQRTDVERPYAPHGEGRDPTGLAPQTI